MGHGEKHVPRFPPPRKPSPKRPGNSQSRHFVSSLRLISSDSTQPRSSLEVKVCFSKCPNICGLHGKLGCLLLSTGRAAASGGKPKAMKRCESCGHQESDGAGVCSRCQASLFAPMSISPSPTRFQPTRILPCLSCGQLNQLPHGVTAENRVILCGRCRVPLKELSTTPVRPPVEFDQFPRVTLGIYLAGLVAVAGTFVWGFNGRLFPEEQRFSFRTKP